MLGINEMMLIVISRSLFLLKRKENRTVMEEHEKTSRNKQKDRDLKEKNISVN